MFPRADNAHGSLTLDAPDEDTTACVSQTRMEDDVSERSAHVLLHNTTIDEICLIDSFFDIRKRSSPKKRFHS
jgi:hypothetical protein